MKRLSLLLIFTIVYTSMLVYAQNDDQVLNDLKALMGDTATAEPKGKPHNAADKVLDQKTADSKWKYVGAEKTETAEVTASSVAIKTTEVTFDGVSVEKYKVYFAESSLATIQDTTKIKDVIVTPASKKDGMVSLNLNGLKADTTYYVVVSPVDPANPSTEVLSMLSNEVSVKTAKESVVAPAEGSNGLENVSYTYKNNAVTLTRSPLANANVDVQIRHQSETSYKKVSTVKGSEGKVTFDITKSGNYFLKMTATDANGAMVGKEHIQTIKIDAVTTKSASEPVVKTAPKVGPVTDILFALGIFSLLAYFGYRFKAA